MLAGEGFPRRPEGAARTPSWEGKSLSFNDLWVGGREHRDGVAAR
jgi:hypothetical protein